VISVVFLPAGQAPGAAFLWAHLSVVFAVAGGRVAGIDLDPAGRGWRELVGPGQPPPAGLPEVLVGGRPLRECLHPVEVVVRRGMEREVVRIRLLGHDGRTPLRRDELAPGALAGALACSWLRRRAHAALVHAPPLPDPLAELAAAEADRVVVAVPFSGDAASMVRAVARAIGGCRPGGSRGVAYVFTGVADAAAAARERRSILGWLDPEAGGPGGWVLEAGLRQPLYAPLPARVDEKTAEDLVDVAVELQHMWDLLGWRGRRLDRAVSGTW